MSASNLENRNNSPWLTTISAADYMQFSPNTLRTYRSRGEGPIYHKVGRAVRYHMDELDNYIMGGKQND